MITTYLIPILIILVLIILNGIYVAAEFALVTASPPRLRSLSDDGSETAKRILEIISKPEIQNKYITTAQVGITIASLGLGMYGEHALAEWILSPLHHMEQISEPMAHTIASVLSVSLLTYLHVVLGEMIPKSFALQKASSVVMALYFPLNLSEKIFFPIVFLMNKLSFGIIAALNLSDHDENSRLFTSKDLEFAVEESHHSGMLEDSDQLFIENILDLDDRTVHQAMTPRNLVSAIPLDTQIETIGEIICQTNKTRYPVYDQTLDNILGVLHLKDLSRYQVHEGKLPEDISLILRPAMYVPETLPLNTLLGQFKLRQTHIAVVLDEFGGTAGVITFEDLIEEVVGEIQDEFDSESPPIQQLKDSLFIVRGDVILEEIEQHLHIKFPSSIVSSSIGGFIMTEKGTIPRQGDKIIFSNFDITVETVQQRTVKFVLIKKYQVD